MSAHHPASLDRCEFMCTQSYHIRIQCLIAALAFGFETNSTRLTTPLCTIAKPLVWHRDEGASSTSLQRSSRTEAEDGTAKYLNEGGTGVAKRGFLGKMFS